MGKCANRKYWIQFGGCLSNYYITVQLVCERLITVNIYKLVICNLDIQVSHYGEIGW